MRWAAWAILGLLGACASAGGSSWDGPWPVRELDRWEVRTGDLLVGHLVLLEIEDAGASAAFYQVQNAQGQWLGFVDAHGRVYQRVPFSMIELFRGVHPMEKALALLYEEHRPLRLARAGEAPVPVEAAARRH